MATADYFCYQQPASQHAQHLRKPPQLHTTMNMRRFRQYSTVTQILLTHTKTDYNESHNQ